MKYPDELTFEESAVMQAIDACRTSAMGDDTCGHCDPFGCRKTHHEAQRIVDHLRALGFGVRADLQAAREADRAERLAVPTGEPA